MLYYCACADFNRHRNNFRNLVSCFLLDYAKKLLKEKVTQRYELLFLFFEAGGLAQEYQLIVDLIPFLRGNFFLTIIIIDEEISKGASCRDKERSARNRFQKELCRYKYVTVEFHETINHFIKQKSIFLKKYFFVLLASFDPYFFIYERVRTKILSLIKYSVLIEAYLYSYRGYRYKQIFEFSIYKDSYIDELLHGLYVLNCNTFILRKVKRDISY